MSFIGDMTALAVEFTTGEMFTDAVLTTHNQGTLNPVTGFMSGDTGDDMACRAVLVPIKIRGENGFEQVRTGAILNIAAQAGDKLTLSGKSYAIEEVTSVSPHGNGIIWKVVLS